MDRRPSRYIFANDRGQALFCFGWDSFWIGEDGVRQGAGAFAAALGGKGFDGLVKNVLRVSGVLVERGDDCHGNRIVFGMPAIVIGDHGDGGVAELGFAGEFGFGDVGHADHVEFHGAMIVRLGQGGKLRAFHADVCALSWAVTFCARRLRQGRRRVAGNGFVEADVGDDAIAEESGDSALGAVEKLVGDQKIDPAEDCPAGSQPR